MAVPKGKTSKARTRRHRSINMQLKVPSLIECTSCGSRVLLHRVCPKCGSYRGKQFVKPEEMA